MKALVFLLPLVAAKSGPVLMREAGTDGMNANIFDEISRAAEAAQKYAAVKREMLPVGAGSLLNPIRANVLPDASRTTLVQKVKRQQTSTTTVTKEVTEKAQATSQEVLVTQTVLVTVQATKPTGNANSGKEGSNGSNKDGGKKKGSDAQNAKETVTTTVTAAAQETGNVNNGNNNNNNNQGNNNNNNNPEASSKSGNAEATQSVKPEASQSANANPEQSASNTNNQEAASKTGNAKVPMGTGGVIVPLSAVVPQGESAQSQIMGTNFAASGFTYKNKQRRARKIRRANMAWWS